MLKRLECAIFGQVQMVMFRDFTQRKAENLGMVGYVRNSNDGSVDVVAEGEENVLQEFLKYISQGPALALVDTVEVRWSEAVGKFSDFEIRYD